MTPRPGPVATQSAEQLQQGIDGALSLMQAAERTKFVEQLVGRRVGRKETPAQALAALLADGQRLARLVSPLPADARTALELLCETAGPLTVDALIALLTELQSERRARAAVVQLLGCGLVLTMAPQPLFSSATWRPPAALLLFQPLARALRPLFDAWWLQAHADAAQAGGQTATPPIDPALTFQERVLLAHLYQTRPRVTNDEGLHAQDQKKVLARFGQFDARALAFGFHTLKRLGLLLRAADGRVTVDSARADELLADGGAAASLALRGSRLSTLSPPARHALALLWRRPGWQRRDQLAALASAWDRSASFDLLPDYYFSGPNAGGAHAGASTGPVDALVEAGFAELDSERQLLRLAAQERWLRQSSEGQAAVDETGEKTAHDGAAGQALAAALAAQRSPDSAAACHLQPNFELIVPPETDAHDLLQLGRVAELQRCDQIATFRLTERSVRAAAAGGLTADRIVAVLQRLAQHGVPDNVARGVRDFAAGARTAHLLQRQIVVVVPPELADEAAAAGLDPGPVPGVFVADKRAQALRALEKAGFTVPAAAAPESGDAWRLGERRAPLAYTDDDLDPEDEDEFADYYEPDDLESDAAQFFGVDEPSLAGGARAVALVRQIPCPPPPPDVALDEAKVEQALARLCGGKRSARSSSRSSARQSREPLDVGAGREPALAAACEQLARMLDVSPAEIPLLVRALGTAPRRWLRQLDDLLREAGLSGFRDVTQLTSRLLSDPELAEVVFDFAQYADEMAGPLDSGWFPLLGDDTVEVALARSHDLWVARDDGSGTVTQVTPHLADTGCRDPFVSGELVEQQESHIFRFQDSWFALGPRSSSEQLRRADEARGLPAAPVGRNSPCPCGSGRKYKKCCMRGGIEAPSVRH